MNKGSVNFGGEIWSYLYRNSFACMILQVYTWPVLKRPAGSENYRKWPIRLIDVS